jgi:hypothetical protein
MNKDPNDPISSLLEASVSLHQMFVELQDGGFTESQALYLVGQILATSIGGKPGNMAAG